MGTRTRTRTRTRLRTGLILFGARGRRWARTRVRASRRARNRAKIRAGRGASVVLRVLRVLRVLHTLRVVLRVVLKIGLELVPHVSVKSVVPEVVVVAVGDLQVVIDPGRTLNVEGEDERRQQHDGLGRG